MTDVTLPPSPPPATAGVPVRVLRVVRDAVVGVVREFLVGAVRDGRIRLKGLSPAMRTAVLVTATVLLVTFLSFASGDVFRTGRDLVLVPGGRPGRGTLVPEWLVPVTFFLLTVSLALLLTAALHATLWVRVPALGLGLVVAAAFMANAHVNRGLSGATIWPGWVALAIVPLVFAVRWRARPRPGPELVAMLLLLAVTFGVAANAVALADEVSGNGFALRQLALLITQLAALAFPLVFVSGLDVLAFGLDASSWSLRFVDRRIGQVAVAVAVVALGLWRVRDTVVRVARDLGDFGTYDTLMPIAGAALLVAVIGGWWWVIGRLAGWGPGTRPGEDSVEHSAPRVRLSLAGAYSLNTLLLTPVLLAIQVLVQMDWAGDGVLSFMADIVDWLGDDDVITTYRILLGFGLVALGAVEARRGRTAAALFVGTVGLTTLVTELYLTGPLDDLYWAEPESVDAVWLALFVGAAAWWAARRRFTEVRSERILFALLLGALVAQFDFVSDPMGFLVPFTGLGFVVFGLVWGFLTGGGDTAASSPGWPRSTRVFLYLGYSLLSVALLHWSAVAHDLVALEDTQSTGESGVTALGYPLIYAVFALMLAAAVVDRPVDEPEDDEPEDDGPEGDGPEADAATTAVDDPGTGSSTGQRPATDPA